MTSKNEGKLLPGEGRDIFCLRSEEEEIKRQVAELGYEVEFLYFADGEAMRAWIWNPAK
jgi:hypothetical protein